MIFPVSSNPELNQPGTEGIDAFVTSDRLIFLDTEPLLSIALLNRKSEDEAENDIEILSLQYAGLIFSICHIVLLIQDTELDPQLMRFIQTAEMLKPSMALQGDVETSIDYFPYLVFVHTMTDLSTFSRYTIKPLQETYRKIFSSSNLPISNGIGIGTGTIMRSLNPRLCGEPVNLFVLPHYDVACGGYTTNMDYHEIIIQMRQQLLSLPQMLLTHTVLSEKNWWHYTVKIWEDIKKSSVYAEYQRLLPSQANAKAELANS